MKTAGTLISPETWTAAREDFSAGLPAAAVAERHGISERQLRRRAAAEGWRRRDLAPGDAASLRPPPWWLRPPLSRTEVSERRPEFAEIEQAEGADRFFLLFQAEPASLRRFAFRQAAEQAVMDRPQQAVAWMRLVQLVDRCGDRVEREAQAFRDIDHLRAAYLRRLDADDDERAGSETDP
jgi:hypothetical protein